MHKAPTGARFIVEHKKCSTKALSEAIQKLLNEFLSKFKNSMKSQIFTLIIKGFG